MSPNRPIFFASGAPFSQRPSGEGGNAKLPTTQRGPRSAEGSHGALQGLSGRLNLDIPNWKPPYFGRFSPNRAIFFAPNAHLFTTPKWGEGCETTEQTKGRRGTPRKVTEPDGTPKFGNPKLESDIIRNVASKFANILGALNPQPRTRMRGDAMGPLLQHPDGAGEKVRDCRRDERP